MCDVHYFEPDQRLLKKFGFEPKRLPGMYQTNYFHGTLSHLTIFNGCISIYEESEWEESFGEPAEVFRIKDFPIANTKEFLFVLRRIFK
jgi:hypothetical protein